MTNPSGERYTLPATVKVGPERHRLKRSTEVDFGRRWAETDYNLNVITFGTLTRPEKMPSTVLHELIHLVGHVYSIKLEEAQVEALANGLTEALQNLKLLPQKIYMRGE